MHNWCHTYTSMHMIPVSFVSEVVQGETVGIRLLVIDEKALLIQQHNDVVSASNLYTVLLVHCPCVPWGFLCGTPGMLQCVLCIIHIVSIQPPIQQWLWRCMTYVTLFYPHTGLPTAFLLMYAHLPSLTWIRYHGDLNWVVEIVGLLDNSRILETP